MIQLNSANSARRVPFNLGTTLLALLGFTAGQFCMAHGISRPEARILCEQSLQASPARSYLDLSMASEPAAEEATVQATAILDEQKILHFKLWRYGSNWDSRFIEGKMAIQGDPRAMIIILGEETASWFGIKMISGEEMQIPPIQSFNLQTEKANELLRKMNQEEIAARLYYSKRMGVVDDRAYLARVQNYQFPIAMEGPLFVHDVSYHMGGILIPKIILDHFRDQSRTILAAFNDLRLDLETESEAIQQIFYAAERRTLSLLASSIDTATGNIVLVTEARNKLERHRPETQLYKLHALDLIQQTSLRYLIKAWSSLVTAAVLEHLSPRQDNQYGMIPSYETQVEIHRIQKLIASFEANFVQNLPAHLDYDFEYSHEQLATFIDLRVESLKKGLSQEPR